MIKASKKELAGRWLLLVAGLFVMALGVGFSIKADLGTSPISSLPYTVSLVAPGISVGTATIVMHCVFIFIQLLLLRKYFGLSQLLQLPVALIFGWMTDLAVLLLSGMGAGSYVGRWLLCLVGIVLVAVGVSAEVLAGVVTLAGEGLVLALCRVLPVKFGGMKVGFDLTLVAASIVLGLAAQGKVLGVREGTVAAAVLVGLLSRQLCRAVARYVALREKKDGDKIMGGVKKTGHTA